MQGNADPSATGSTRDFTDAGSMRLLDITRDVVQVAAPEELPFLAGLERLDDTQILRRLMRRAKSGDPLGFGLGGSVVLVTPIVWVALHEAADQMGGAAEAGIGGGAGARIRRRLSRSRPPETLPRFGEAQLRVVRARAVELAGNAGMDVARAERLADAVVSRLALGGPGPQASPDGRQEPAPGSRRHGDDHAADPAPEAAAEHVRPATAGLTGRYRSKRGDLAGLDEAVFPVTVYLSDERIHPRVEAAVEELLASAGLRIEDRGEAVFGSFFRRSRAVAREGALIGVHAADQRLVLAQDAAVTATLLQNLAPVIASLQPTKDAQLRVGALLIVKVDWVVNVFQLTAAQQAKLDHQPQLALSPHEIAAALDLTPAGQNGDSPPGLR